MAKFTGHTITSDSALGDAKIQRSLRFTGEDSNDHYLQRTPSSAGNRQICTFSCWTKRSNINVNHCLASAYSANNDSDNISLTFRSLGSGNCEFRVVGYNYNFRITDRKFRDPSAWFHVVVAFDTTQSSADDRVKVYINGVQETSFSTSGNVTQNMNIAFNDTSVHRIGTQSNQISNTADGYIAEVNFIDGYQYDPSYFGFTDPVTGIWMPKRYEGTYGTNGYYLDFSDNSSAAALGIDKSPNGNDFTVNNISVSAGTGNDSSLDTPSNNFCTMNPLMMNGTEVAGTHSNGLLTWKSDNNYATTQATFPVTTGKWYWECEMESQYVNIAGITRGTSAAENTYIGYDTNGNLFGFGYYYNDGTVKGTTDGLGTTSNNNLATSQTTAANGDILGIASDIANGYLIFYKNGTHIYTITGINNTFDWFPSFSAYGTSATWHVNYGQRPFTYTPPVGHKSLCSKNLLPDSSLLRPQKFFDSVTYTGNDSSQSITSLEFQPDLIWFKNRGGTNWHAWFDSVRGRAKGLASNKTNTEYTSSASNDLVSFDISGFTLGSNENWGSVNGSSNNIVAWTWKAGGNSNTFNIDGVGYATAAAAGLDGGTATPTGASVNTKAGFSILKYNGTANQSISHGLSQAPELTIEKELSNSTNWTVTTTAIDDSLDYLYLNTSDAKANYTVDLPTSSLVDIGRNNECIMYMWHSVPGYSKIGSYKGNGNANGSYVHLGFKPAWIIIKRTSLSGNSWAIIDNKRDPINPTTRQLFSNVENVEYTTSTNFDFLSNGFKPRSSSVWFNASGHTYLYMAFAETPEATPFDTFPNAR